MIDLCVDICQRNGIKALNYTGDAKGNLTEHRMFMATTCPGPYLHARMSRIAAEVNKRLGKTSPRKPRPRPTTRRRRTRSTWNCVYSSAA